MGKLQRSWIIFTSSFQILKENKRLLLFPLINFLIILFICALFIAPAGVVAHQSGAFEKFMKEINVTTQAAETSSNHAATPTKNISSDYHFSPTVWIIWGALYFVSIFIATYLNVAFFSEILNTVRGGEVSLARGFAVANSKIVQIFMWACLAGTVGIIIKMLEERMGLIGQIIMKLIGVVWSVASLFVIPVIITEESTNLNPFSYLKKSALTITRTWGESIAGYLGFGAINGLIMICGILVMIAADAGVLALFSGQQTGVILAVTISSVCLLSMIGFLYTVSVAEKIFKGALYLYASEGTVPNQYSQELLDSAWKRKK